MNKTGVDRIERRSTFDLGIRAAELGGMFIIFPGSLVTVREVKKVDRNVVKNVYRKGKVIQETPNQIFVAFDNYIEGFPKQSLVCGDVDIIVKQM